MQKRLLFVLLIQLSFVALHAQDCIRYERKLYPHWIDADGDGLNTRKEVLNRFNLDHSGPKQGRWFDPYTNRTFTQPESLQIDHVVALSEAHKSGAWAWDEARRTAYANDLGVPENLLAVYGPVNEDKSDHDPAHWLPPAKEYHIRYAKQWLAVKVRWGLSMDSIERDALRGILGNTSDSLKWPVVQEEYLCGKKKNNQRENSLKASPKSDCCRHCAPGRSKPCGDACIGPKEQCDEQKGCACWATVD